MRTIASISFALASLTAFASPQPLGAQAADGGVAWAGCWEPLDGVAPDSRTCVVPEAGDRLSIHTVAADGSVTQSTLALTGARVPVTVDQCSGWESAWVSKDGDRIVVDSELSCPDAPPRKRTTAFLITSSGLWLQVNASGIAVASNAQVRVFRPVESYAGIPAELRAAVAAVAAEGDLRRSRMKGHSVSASDLVELETAGVSTAVIDLVVAAGYPKSFVIDARSLTAQVQEVAAAPRPAREAGAVDPFFNRGFYWANGFPMYSAYDLAVMRQCRMFGGFSCQNLWSAGMGFGWGINDWWGMYPAWGGIPVVVRPVTPPPSNGGTLPPGGRAVRGRGYTSSGASDRSAAPRSSTGSSGVSASGASSSGGGSGGGGASAGSAGGGGGGGRTAKPRTP